MLIVLQPYLGSQRDVMSALEDLLAEAKGPNPPIGLAYVVIRYRRVYSVGAAGEARRQTLLTRGLVAMLDDELALLHPTDDPHDVPHET